MEVLRCARLFGMGFRLIEEIVVFSNSKEQWMEQSFDGLFYHFCPPIHKANVPLYTTIDELHPS
jgi:hypothetical protein